MLRVPPCLQRVSGEVARRARNPRFGSRGNLRQVPAHGPFSLLGVGTVQATEVEVAPEDVSLHMEVVVGVRVHGRRGARRTSRVFIVWARVRIPKGSVHRVFLRAMRRRRGPGVSTSVVRRWGR